VSNSEISEVAGVSRPTVLAWRGQFEKDGLIGFGEVAKGRGRKPSVSDEKVAEIVELTLHSKPEGETHWSCRSMAKQAGVSSASVQRIWSARGLKPHLANTFTLSNDRHFEEKLIDVVGLYLDPTDKAVVLLCMDEKIQALDQLATRAVASFSRGRQPLPALAVRSTATSAARLDDPKVIVDCGVYAAACPREWLLSCERVPLGDRSAPWRADRADHQQHADDQGHRRQHPPAVHLGQPHDAVEQCGARETQRA
jgi:hypothetical protein